MNARFRLLIAAMVAALAVGLAACGGGSSSSSSSVTESAEGGESEQSSFSYGYSIPTGQNAWISTIAESAQEKADAAGGEGELADAQLDPANAVTQLNRFLTQGDEVLAIAPAQVPQAVEATLKKASSAGTPSFAVEWSFAAGEPEAAPKPPVNGQVSVGREQLGEEVAEMINEDDPSGAEVIYVGLPFPVAGVDFFQEVMEEHLGKSKVVANLDDPTDNAQGALGPVSGALGANPNASAIVTYNGPSAAGSVQAVKSAGLTGKVNIYCIQLDSQTAKLTEEGAVRASWDINPIEIGDALGEMIAAAGTGEPESAWAKTVVIEPKVFTKENVKTWENWESGS